MTYDELEAAVKVWGHRAGLSDDLAAQFVKNADERIRGDFWGELAERETETGADPLPLGDGIYLAAALYELRRYREDAQGMERALGAYIDHRASMTRAVGSTHVEPGRAPQVRVGRDCNGA